VPFFVTSRKVWPIAGILVLLVVLEGLDAWGLDRLSSHIAFVVVFVTGIICVIGMLKDAFWPR
jgi:hypothetical protein